MIKVEDLYTIPIEDIQSQYRDTNIKKLLVGIADIKRRYLLKGLESLRNHNLSITTAKGDGLDMWGLLLKFYRHIPSDTSSDNGVNYFNFNNKNFRRLSFYNPNNPNYSRLTDDIYRKFLVLMYQQMFVVNTIPVATKFINEFFDEFDRIELIDSYDMSYQVYVFVNDGNFPVWLKWVLSNYDILLRPAGVGARFIDRQKLKRFGFAPENTTDSWYFKNIGNFGNSNFIDINEIGE